MINSKLFNLVIPDHNHLIQTLLSLFQSSAPTVKWLEKHNMKCNVYCVKMKKFFAMFLPNSNFKDFQRSLNTTEHIYSSEHKPKS